MPEGFGFLEGFWGHVDEFIKRMKVVLATFLIALFIMLILPGNSDIFAMTNDYKPLMSVVLTYISKMFLPPDAQLFAVSMSDPITLYVYAALVFAIGITFPVFAYEAFKFVDPALYPNEKKMLFPYVAAVTALFIGGSIFGFLFLAPSFVSGFFPFYRAVGAIPYIPIVDFYNIVFFTIIISGVLFTIPVFFVILVKFNIIKTKMVAGKRKYIYAGIGIAAMLISPGATPLGDLYLFIALAVLVEGSILIGKTVEYRKGTSSQPSYIQMKLFPTAKCRFCKTNFVDESSSFCPNCQRSIK
jgi:sec-independent protein translocase protein TatC